MHLLEAINIRTRVRRHEVGLAVNGGANKLNERQYERKRPWKHCHNCIGPDVCTIQKRRAARFSLGVFHGRRHKNWRYLVCKNDIEVARELLSLLLGFQHVAKIVSRQANNTVLARHLFYAHNMNAVALLYAVFPIKVIIGNNARGIVGDTNERSHIVTAPSKLLAHLGNLKLLGPVVLANNQDLKRARVVQRTRTIHA